ncbi:UDP-N-acetylmuramate--L-alanine ligase [Christiangramia sabulilitoris]|uniref:UDP-N-acetylmuramate--L-alanine ligase n=1 Tax=Christiangramia sabulilitoris TaxID=2583991 RepID=A0A550I3S0_9FLAO|nr:UDP-N-acetylmuramate--L-alanine ligase [Christiangramia sabulilitoris]TRO65623.1 UDP-N-acetylmuramate--L-alanine ligase [Christiangramia sabulilitoris]
MKDLNHIKHLYFIGIGGIGMSALARYFKAKGNFVAGYDRTSTELTKTLQKEGIEINYSDEVNDIPEDFINNPQTSVIVYTPAVPKDFKQFLYLKEQNFEVLKRAQLLGMVTKQKYCLAVAGTHGKTTTTAILGHLLKETGAKVTAFLGGISEDIQSNLIMQGDDVVVVEADEFDRSFLNLSPNLAAITSMDADHLDIYGDKSELEKSFQEFAAKVPEDGRLFFKNGLPLKGASIGVNDNSDYSAENIRIEDGSYVFDLRTPSELLQNLKFNLPGKHNLLNAITALAMAIQYGSPTDGLTRALFSFKGVKRRFSYKIKTDKLILIDDYAHHPTEISAVHQAVREMYPNNKVLAVFQPHLFSRTRDFAEDFASSLTDFDKVFLLDIYPARELPIEGISSAWLLDKISNPEKELIHKSELIEKIKSENAEIIVMMGAGDIGEEIDKVKKALLNEA